MQNKTDALLEIQNLSVSFLMYDHGLEQRQLQVISDLHLSLYPGEIVAIAGSSGSGKSLLASAILGILPDNAQVEGQLRYRGQSLTPEKQKTLRGSHIALVPQSVSYLDPLMKLGPQVDGPGRPKPTEKRKKLFSRFGLPAQTETLYPF
jgi:peptide/nickel transport system ATP-binding protein